MSINIQNIRKKWGLHFVELT